MKLENIILSEITQTQKDTYGVYVLTYNLTLAIKFRITVLKSTDPKKLGNKEALYVPI